GGEEAGAAPLGISGGAHRNHVFASPGRETGVRGGEGGPGDASQEQPGPSHARQAEGLRGARAPASGSESGAALAWSGPLVERAAEAAAGGADRPPAQGSGEAIWYQARPRRSEGQAVGGQADHGKDDVEGFDGHVSTGQEDHRQGGDDQAHQRLAVRGQDPNEEVSGQEVSGPPEEEGGIR